MSKKALLVGINQFVPPIKPLHGCVNDVVEMNGLLKECFEFQDGDIRALQDADATRQGIRHGLAWLLGDYEGGGKDVRVFHFSSHGTQVDDKEGEEWDCQDEVIVPHDHDWDNPFRDDDLRQVFAAIPDDVNFTFIADCCHSGSIQKDLLDSRIEFTPRYLTPPFEITDRIDAKIMKRDQELNAYTATQMAEALKNVPPEQWAEKMKLYLDRLTKSYKQNNFAIVEAERHILLAACQDRQTAADARIDGEYRGAFTWALAGAIREANGNLTYAALIQRAAARLKKYEQKPQLECTKALRNIRVFAPLGG